MNILGIESSCDETAAAVVRDGTEILSNAVASQIEVHRRYGGIVPEVASRQHLLSALPVLEEALRGISRQDLSAIAVTVGPGLAGSLLVGINLAKALSLAWGLPLVGVNHLEAHIYANWLGGGEPPGFPALCLIVSGGHTDLVLMRGHGQYRVLGRTHDDAAGEAFDKVARLLGLGYPGGPAIEEAAKGATASYPLPRPWLKGSDDFSFSGLKTAVAHLVRNLPTTSAAASIAASFQETVVDVLATKAMAAARRHRPRCLVLAGGVAANKALRAALSNSPLPVHLPHPSLCTDNAAMVASCGYFRLQAGWFAAWDLDAVPGLRLT